MTGRKHVMVYEVEAQIRTDDVEKLLAAVAEQRDPTFAFGAADDDETTADFTEFFVSYGPVRGANRTDVTRYLQRNKVDFILDDATARTTLTCGCASSSQSCTDGVAPTADGPVTSPTNPEWQPGMDW